MFMAKNYDEKTRRKILTGNVWSIVLSITLPLFLYQFINSFYSLIDQIMVANISSESVSAVATISQIKSLISSLGAGIAGGGAIIVSRLYGAGKIDEARKNANVVFTIDLVLLVLVLLCIPFSDGILRLAQVPDDLIKISSTYFRLQLIEQGVIIFNNLFISIEKSKGNTKIILISNLILMFVKLSLNALFIYGLQVDNLVYVEIASLFAQTIMLVIGLYRLFSKNNIFRIHHKEFSLKWSYVRKIIAISLPLFLGKFVISLGKVSVNAMCKAYGSLTVGALGISNTMTGLITNPGTAFEDSESSLISQNLGNRNMKRTLQIFLRSAIFMAIWSCLGFICVRFLFEDQIVNLFNTKNDSPEFVQMIKDIFFYDCLTIPALAINSVILGLLYGYGQTKIATVNNLLRIITRISTLAYLQKFHPEIGSAAAGISMGISNIAIAIFALILLTFFLFRTKIKGYKGMHFTDKEPEMVEVNGILINKGNLTNEN
jgi:putative MATE family efflux protein